MLVEFIGESGCGKSTLARYIAKNEMDVKLCRNSSNLFAMRLFLKNIKNKEYRKLLKLIYGLSLKSFKTKRLAKNALYLIKLLNMHFFDFRNDEKVFLLDQGLVQFLYTIFFNNMVGNDAYKEILKFICDDFQLYFVFCQCSDDIMEKRIMKRSAGGVEKKRRIEDAIGRKDIMDYHKRVFKLLAEEIPPERIINVDTSMRLKDNQELICKWIRSKYA